MSEEKKPHFTHAGLLHDPTLDQLRDQIKKVMIPLLIKTFQLRLELNQTLSLPSRVQSAKHKSSSEEIIEQLNQLDKDLNVLLLWCQSCRNHIQKALQPPEEKSMAVTPQALSDAVSPPRKKWWQSLLN